MSVKHPYRAAIYISSALWFNVRLMSDFILLWTHVLSLAVFFGSGVTLLVTVLPPAAQIDDPTARQTYLAKGLKYYNPLSIGSLGVVLMTGAWNLTAFKAKPGLAFFTPEGYLSDFGSLLSLKLLIVFILINVSAAVSLGMGHRLVRTEVRGEAFPPDKLPGLVRRIQVFTGVALVLTAWIVWISLDMSRLGLAVSGPGL